jgi:hypothetical protein
MKAISPRIDKTLNISTLTSDAENQIEAWKEQHTQIEALLENDQASFDDIKEFLRDRLMSHACFRNQGYVMSNFRLDSTKARFIFDDTTKPDFVIIFNRLMEVDAECFEIEERNDESFDRPKKTDEKSKMQRKLKSY